MILRGTLCSRLLERDTSIEVVFPPVHTAGQPLKVVYLLRSPCGGSDRWLDSAPLPRYAQKYKAVFILPEAGRSLCADEGHELPHFRYLTQELPELCRAAFQISARREDTSIIGGYGAIKAALTYPETYGCCCALALQGGDDLLTIAQQFSQRSHPKLRLYLSCGQQDPRLEEHRTFVKSLAALQIRAFYTEQQGVQDGAFFHLALENALDFTLPLF